MKQFISSVFALVLLCYLGVHGEYLALYEDGRLRQVFPYHLDSYSPAEQADLKNGIPYHTSSELQHLLEDYMS